MASYYELSVKEFAKQVTGATSEERQRMLRHFYSLQHPEVKEFLVDSASEVVSSVHKEEEKVGNNSKERGSLLRERPSNDTLSCNDPANKMSQVYNPKLCEGKSSRSHNHGSHKEETFCSDAKIKRSPVSSTQETDSERNDHTPNTTTTLLRPHSKSNTLKTELGDTPGQQQNLPGPCSSRSRAENPVSDSTSVEGLLGDTSILNDLFKTRGEGPTQLPKNVLSRPVAKAKQRPKDFWDILNEQNDDSLSKLTDLTVIETLCTQAPRTTVSTRKDELDASLWKANEKFLWKTFNSNVGDKSVTSTEGE